MARKSVPKPAAYVAAGRWPDGRIEGPIAAQYAAEIARRLRDELGGRSESIRSLARAAGVSHTTVNSLLAGETYPDTKTLAALEATLDVPLIPDWADRRRL